MGILHNSKSLNDYSLKIDIKSLATSDKLNKPTANSFEIQVKAGDYIKGAASDS